MAEAQIARRYRFGAFELDALNGELRRRGLRVKLHSQPLQLLLLLVERQGEVITREEICRNLWPDGTWVDYEHSVNSAINRLREALGDKANNPRFIETLSRRGYRFVAPVERIAAEMEGRDVPAVDAPIVVEAPQLTPAQPEQRVISIDRVLATPEELPGSNRSLVLTLFLLLQAMYLAFYVAALANLGALEQFFAPLRFGTQTFQVVAATAALLIPVRVFLISAVLFRAPGLREKYLRIWRWILPFDVLWSLAPFLLHGMNYGLALASMTLLVYSPFAQRSLILMGAGEESMRS